MRYALLLLASLHVCMAAGADPDPRARGMQTAVLREQNLSQVESYLKGGFDPQAPIGCGTFDSLDGAVFNQNLDMVALLLRYGARPKESTFVNAAFLDPPEMAVRIVSAFLQAGSDVNSKMSYRGTPSHYWTALHHAVWRQNVGLVRLLVSQKGISLNDVDGDGYTALETAQQKGNATIVGLLLEAGADPSVKGFRAATSTLAASTATNPPP
jgi:ankyrin repeat protein